MAIVWFLKKTLFKTLESKVYLLPVNRTPEIDHYWVMGGKKNYIVMFGSFTEPFKWFFELQAIHVSQHHTACALWPICMLMRSIYLLPTFRCQFYHCRLYRPHKKWLPNFPVAQFFVAQFTTNRWSSFCMQISTSHAHVHRFGHKVQFHIAKIWLNISINGDEQSAIVAQRQTGR